MRDGRIDRIGSLHLKTGGAKEIMNSIRKKSGAIWFPGEEEDSKAEIRGRWKRADKNCANKLYNFIKAASSSCS